MKSLAQQSVAEMGGRGSVFSRQKRDHIKLDELLRQLERLPVSEQQPVLLRIYRLVFPHAFAEESALWPLMRRLLPGGEQLTLRVEREHQAINQLVTRLEGLDPRSAERGQVLERIIGLLRQDVRDEEDVLLPRLQMKLAPRQVRRLGLAWETVRRIAPTRAHPVVSRRPPGNVLAALPLSLLDRSRDRVDMLVHRGARPATQGLRALSAWLGRASRTVEQRPIFQRGEDPATHIARKSGANLSAAVVVTVVTASAVVALARRRRYPAAANSKQPSAPAASSRRMSRRA